MLLFLISPLKSQQFENLIASMPLARKKKVSGDSIFEIKYIRVITILNLKAYNKLCAEDGKKKILANPPE